MFGIARMFGKLLRAISRTISCIYRGKLRFCAEHGIAFPNRAGYGIIQGSKNSKER